MYMHIHGYIFSHTDKIPTSKKYSLSNTPHIPQIQPPLMCPRGNINTCILYTHITHLAEVKTTEMERGDVELLTNVFELISCRFFHLS